MTSFKDHFSGHASVYATFRPKSPPALFPYLASLCVEKKVAWDVGTGNGQAALELVSFFEKVIATDASKDQIKQAIRHPKVSYHVAPAENAGFLQENVNLTTVAQALHWFDFEKFYAEVRRVSTPDAVLAAWSYDLAHVTPEIDTIVGNYYDGDLKDFWPPERKWVDDRYRNIPFPFEEVSAPTFSMTEERTLAEWCGYLFSWSATQRAIKAGKKSDFDHLVNQLERVWGNPATKKTISWPLALRVGRIR